MNDDLDISSYFAQILRVVNFSDLRKMVLLSLYLNREIDLSGFSQLKWVSRENINLFRNHFSSGHKELAEVGTRTEHYLINPLEAVTSCYIGVPSRPWAYWYCLRVLGGRWKPATKQSEFCKPFFHFKWKGAAAPNQTFQNKDMAWPQLRWI